MGTKRSSTTRDQARTRLARTRPNCHICGKPIDWDADWKDPQSFVVDHVIPLAKGGEDALSNMRAAHRHRTRPLKRVGLVTGNATAKNAHAIMRRLSGGREHSTAE